MIAVVDDEPLIQSTLVNYFENAGFAVRGAETAEQMRRLMARERIDFVLLDIRLPDGDGLALMRDIRAESDVPVILITSRAEEADRIIGLELGADDYVTKPFSPREVLARVKTVLRRTRAAADPGRHKRLRRFAGWCLDLETHRLTSPTGETTRLTSAEFELLALLVRHPGRIMSRNDLLDVMSNREWDPNDRTVDVLVGRLRRKIEADPAKPQIILTEYGLGYVFAEKVA
ncbi:response regulator [Bradyrhizobium oligotrophicum]|uniref:response regulator n=1 Tax=Bradyrhizobium oligotrophicum TaxID=44255 RepID=UPI003EBA18C5